MKSLFLLLFLITLTQSIFADVFFYGSKDGVPAAVNLTDKVANNSDPKSITFGTLDPTAVAVNAAQGSVYISTSAMYQKLDNGSSTNWVPMLIGPSGSGTDECVARWNGTGVPLLQNSVFCITDAGYATGLASISNNVTLTPANPGAPTFVPQNYFAATVSPTANATNLDFATAQIAVAPSSANSINRVSALELSNNSSGGGAISQYKVLGIGGSVGDGVSGGTVQSADAINVYINSQATQTISNGLGGITLGVGALAGAITDNIYGINTNLTTTGNITNGATVFNFSLGGAGDLGYAGYLNGSGQIDGNIAGAFNASNLSPIFNGTIGGGYNGYYTNPTFNQNINGLTGFFLGGNGTGYVDNFIGLQINPQQAGGGQYLKGASISLNPDSTVNSTGLDISIPGDSANGNGVSVYSTGTFSSGFSGFSVDVSGTTVTGSVPVSYSSSGGVLNLNSARPVGSGGGFTNGSIMTITAATPSGGPSSGDYIGLNMPMLFTANDDHTSGGFGIGVNAVGYVSTLNVAAGKTVSKLSNAVSAFNDTSSGAGSVITDAAGFRSVGALTTGGSVAITNLSHFKADTNIVPIGTNIFGVNIEDPVAENYFSKSIVIGGAAFNKVSNSDVALEIASLKAIRLPSLTTVQKNGLTALESMFVYDDTTNKPSYYDGTSWVDVGSSLTLATNSGLRTDATGLVEAVTQTNGQILIGSTGTKPQAATLTATANQTTITNGAGSITIGTAQDIASGSSPTFAGLTLTGFSGFLKATAGAISTALVNLTSDVTGTLPIGNGGTNSSTALNNNRIMISSGGAIVEQSALTASAPMRTNASGLPTTGSTSLTTEVSGVLPLANGGSNKNMTASAGSLVYSDADSFEFSAVGTVGQALVSGGAGAPTFYAPTATRCIYAGASGVLADDAGCTYDAVTDIMTLVGGLNAANLSISGNTLSSSDANGNIVLNPNGTGQVNLPDLTASLPLQTDASKNVVSAAINLSGSQVTSTLGPTNGGTGQSTYTTGDILYASAANTLSKLAAGTNGKYLQMTAGVPAWASPPAGSTSYVRVNAVSGTPGRGSTNTTVRYYSNTAESSGTDITYTSSATNGDSFTINTPGVYHIAMADTFSAGAYCAVTKNGTQLSTDPGSLTNSSNIIGYGETGNTTDCSIATVAVLAPGDIIRPQVSTTAGTGTTYKTYFSIAREVGINDAVKTLGYSKITGSTAADGYIPADNTIPQITEGTQIFSMTVTPTRVGAKIHVYINVKAMEETNTGGTIAVALFKDGASDAVAVDANGMQDATTNLNEGRIILDYEYTTVSLTPISFTARIGGNANPTDIVLNESEVHNTPADVDYGNTISSWMKVTEEVY